MALSDLIFPTRCAGCGQLGPSPCATCIDRLCVRDEIEIGDELDRCLVLLDYDDLARRLVTKVKYGGVRTGIAWFAEAMAARVVAAGEHVDLVTWVPASRDHRRRRGFDQGEALATPIARQLGVRAIDALRRRGRGSQTRRDRAERLAGPRLETAATSRALVQGRVVLLVDDVVTTGASLRAAAVALRRVGAARIVAVVAAHRDLELVTDW